MTAWLPLAAELLRPVPTTETDVALLVLHVTVVEPGAAEEVGLTAMEPSTLAMAVKFAVTV